MIDDGSLRKAVEELAANRGFFIVDLQNKKGKIQVIIDDYQGIKLDECVEINRDLRSLFGEKLDDVDLEVTSPGLTEPFKVYEQYDKNVGRKVQVQLTDGRQISGKLQQVAPDQIVVEEKKRIKNEKNKKKTVHEEHEVPFAEIQHTKLLISF
jgi:ribosome maturation factor RimP